MAASLLFCVLVSTAAPTDRVDPPAPDVVILPTPGTIMPGEPVRVRVQWRLVEPAMADPTPAADLTEARLHWDAMERTETSVAWEGAIVALQPGPLVGQITCSAALPLLPADLPAPALFPVSPRYLANLYSPCRSRHITRSVALPQIDIAPWPTMPPGTPPFVGLLGTWSAVLTTDRTQVSLREPFGVSLSLRGHGSAALFHAPQLYHPDLDILPPTVARSPNGDDVQVRWMAIPSRVPLEPLHLRFSTLDRGHYVGHRLELAIDVLPEPPPQAGASAPPPVLLRFCPLPDLSAPTRGGVLGAAISAGFGALLGLLLAGAARRRDFQRSHEGRRQAALRRLRQTRLIHADRLPTVYSELRLWLELPDGAGSAEIEAALRPTHPELASELRALETRRFSPTVTPTDAQRLSALLRRLGCLAALAALGLLAPAALPPEEALSQVAEEAFRQRDFAQACNALLLLRQRGHESPELLLNLANAYWFTGRHIEALALYERAARLAPRRQDSREGMAWLRTHLRAPLPATEASWILPLRDRLRPDEWVFVAGVLAGLGCVLAGLLRWWRQPVRYVLGIVVGTAFVCLSAAVVQSTGAYRVGANARLTQDLPLRAAPAALAEVLTPVQPAGTLVTPTATRTGWVQVRTPSAEGWVPESGCILVW